MNHRLVVFSVIGALLPLSVSAATPWNLPQTLTDEIGVVSFAVDSTWHLIEGKTSGLSGQVWLEDPLDPLSIRVKAVLPVDRFDTDRSSRDRELRKVMHADLHPAVSFVGRSAFSRAPDTCTPESVRAGGACELVLRGVVTINGVEKPAELPVKVTRTEKAFIIDGALTLQWVEFGVEDPSILIAKLDETVRVKVSVRLED
jgi:polyisoprenoid-binding protein YceI